MDSPNILAETRYDRLLIYYDQLKSLDNEFTDVEYKGLIYHAPEKVTPDKNAYRKRFKLPIKMGHTKQYYLSLYGDNYKLYKKDSQLYFIDCSQGVDQYTREQAFGTSMLYPYIAMMIYELIIWLINKKNRYVINIHDEVFSPLFNYPQWMVDYADINLYVTMFPDKSIERNDHTIVLSIFGNK